MKKRFNLPLAIGLLLMSILAIIIFRTMKDISLSSYLAAVLIYGFVTLGAAAAYVILNRGLAGHRVTPDMLPKDWTEEKKLEFIKELQKRQSASKKLLILLIPFIATFIFEIADMYIFQNILSLFKS